MRKLLFLAAGIIALYVPALGQQNAAEKGWLEQERDIQRQKVRVQSRRSEYKPLPKKATKEIKAALAPNPEDLAEYKDFLQQPKTGLFRLLPNLDCSSKYIVSADEDCRNSTFIGEFYSFRAKNYSDFDFFDITFKNEELISGGFLSQGILVSLGDVPLENLSPISSGVEFLFNFKPQTESEAVKKQFAEIAAGVNFDGYKYTKSEKARLNTTYALRAVAYRPEDKVILRLAKYESSAQDTKFLQSRHDARTDLTLAFRIVRKDADGSLTIRWKELGRNKSPKIIFPKDEPLTDINK